MNIAFDIGGTNMRIAAADGESLGEIRKVPTPQNLAEGVAAFAQIAKELTGGMIGAAAGGVPGSVAEDGSLYDAPNLAGWMEGNVTKELSAALGVPARLFNDTVVIGYAELKHGGGRGSSNIVYITVSTGVGGALINEDDLSKCSLLTELEIKRTMEGQISGTAIKKKFGIHPKDLDSLDERNKLADILADGLGIVTEAWKPSLFVIGGSMITGQNPIPLERVRETFTAVPVKMAELKDDGGLIGAAAIAAQS